MYTTKIIEKTIQRSAKRVVVKVEFTKDGVSDTEDFSFGFTSFSLDALKKSNKHTPRCATKSKE